MGIPSYFLISSTSTLTSWHRSAGIGLLLLAMAGQTPNGNRSQSTWNISGHVLVLKIGELLLLELLQSDRSDNEADGRRDGLVILVVMGLTVVGGLEKFRDPE